MKIFEGHQMGEIEYVYDKIIEKSLRKLKTIKSGQTYREFNNGVR